MNIYIDLPRKESVDVLTCRGTTVLLYEYVFGFGIMYLDFGIGLLKTDKVILNTSN